MRLRVRYLLGTSFALACLVAAPGTAGTGAAAPAECGLDAVARDAWYAVPAPGPGTWWTGMVGDDPCVLVAASASGVVQRSVDAGRTWTAVYTHPVALGRVFTEGLGSTVVVAESASPGFAISRDGGATFTRDLLSSLPTAPGTTVVSVAGDGSTLVLARRPVATGQGGTPTVYVSAGGSDVWAAMPGSAALWPVAVAWDATARAVYVADVRPGNAGGIWRSASGGATFDQLVGLADVTDVVLTPLDGGGQAIYAPTAHGVWDSVDGGFGWGTEGTTRVAAMRPEWGRSGVLTAAYGSPARLGRSADAGATFRRSDAGIPATCAPSRVERTRQVPSYFLVSCADGRAFRFRSSGVDFVGALPPAGGPGPGPGATPLPGQSGPTFVPAQMVPLKSWPLEAQSSTGSIAFDGKYLYYGDTGADGGLYRLGAEVHRMDATTGVAQPVVDAGHSVFALDVDRDRRRLFVQTDTEMYATGLGGGRSAKLFDTFRDDRELPPAVAFSWDATLQQFWTFGHASHTVYRVSRSGALVSSCDWSLGGTTNLGRGSIGAAAIAAAGDGTAYVENEDDTTVVRISRRCSLLGVYLHPKYSEVPAENDAIACDTNTFPDTAAIWIRDGDRKTVTAYEVPGGYCPLPTVLTISAPVRMALVARARVCATLRTPWGEPIGDEDVALFGDSVPLGTGRTSASGRVCADYVPALHHPLGAAAAAGEKPLLAVFLGTASYRASQARGALTVVGGPAPVVAEPPAAVVPPAEAPVRAPPQQPVEQAPQLQAGARQAQAQSHAQAQAQAQAQAHPVTQVNPNLGFAAQQQEQPQLAFVMEGDAAAETANEWEMSARPRRRAAPFATFALAACGLAMACGCAFAVRTARAPTGH